MSIDARARVEAAATPPRRGTLRVYLGAAPGVGKTFAMLNEGQRAKSRGTDVVVGYVETHGRARTAEAIGDLEVVPRRTHIYRGTEFEEMDTEAIIARKPTRVLVDELAHTNVPGSGHEKRWRDVQDLLDAGIDVISTLNIQHLESINDVVERITGVRQRETIPDDIVRRAEQIELVDLTPEALRRRMAHGNIYAPDKVDAALSNYFRPGNLTALRELALLWLADQVEVGLEQYRQRHGITEPWETRERVVVALSGGAGSEAPIRRAARIAHHSHGELIGVHVRSEEGLAATTSPLIERHRQLLEDLGGEFHEVVGVDVAAALVEFARAENATQLVLGASNRSRWDELVRGSVVNRTVRLSGPIDVHVISHQALEDSAAGASAGRTPFRSWRGRMARRPVTSSLSPRRQMAGWVLALAGMPLLTAALAQVRGQVGLGTLLLAFLSLVVVVASTGGTLPALFAAIEAFLLANYYFTPPLHRWTVAEGENLVALVVFLAVALIVSRFVDISARRAHEVAGARSRALTLARLAATIGEHDPLPILLEHLRTAFGLRAAALLRRDADGRWHVDAGAGEPLPGDPGQADTVEELSSDVVLALDGPTCTAEDQIVLNAFADQLAAVLEHSRLRVEAGRARALSDANALRGALLQAVSHDLRTPLASIKASASSLAQQDVKWSAEDTAAFITTINEETDRLTALVGNLLDMSRIQAGALRPSMSPTPLEDVLPSTVLGLGSNRSCVAIEAGEDLPLVQADPMLLERALANVIENAVRFSPPGERVRVTASPIGDRLHLQVVDRGRGIPERERGRLFEPFQRLGDSGSGVGLGLAVAHGFLNAMGGTIEFEDTPGGGTTAVITLPIAR